MHNGKYHTEQYKRKQQEKVDRLFGPEINHNKTCKICYTEFNWFGRENTKKYDRAVFCSTSCAHNRSEWWINNATHYRTICWNFHKRECLVCGFSNVVAVHHVDHNRWNNDPKNLVPLCPNHHEMIHTKEHSAEIQKFVDKYIEGL